jgi:hypothetical protein
MKHLSLLGKIENVQSVPEYTFHIHYLHLEHS